MTILLCLCDISLEKKYVRSGNRLYGLVKVCKQVMLRCRIWHLSRDAAVSSIRGRVLQFSGIRAGIGSMRAFKYYTAPRYLDKMHGGMRESAESRHIKGIICIPCICDTCFPVSQYMRSQDKIGSPILNA